MLFADQDIAALEALLFMAKEPLSMPKLADLLETSEENVAELWQSLRERYEIKASGLTLVELDHCYRLGTKPEMAPYIETLYKQPTQMLSNAALEVLSIVAYRQPITRGEIDFIGESSPTDPWLPWQKRGWCRKSAVRTGPEGRSCTEPPNSFCFTSD
jgi:segregation and condensation protein B